MGKSDNSIVVILVLVAIITVLGVLFALRVMSAGNTNTNEIGIQDSIEKQGSQTSGKTENDKLTNNASSKGTQTNEMSAQEFNAIFAQYIGQQRRGVSIKALIDEVNKNNTTYKNRNITIEYDGKNYTNDFTELSNSISTTDQYDVKLGYDSEGYVNKVTISK